MMMLIILLVYAVYYFTKGIGVNKKYFLNSLLVILVFNAPNIYYYGFSLVILLYLFLIEKNVIDKSCLYNYYILLSLFVVGSCSFLISFGFDIDLVYYRIKILSPYLQIFLLITIVAVVINDVDELNEFIKLYFLLVFFEILITGLIIYYAIDIALVKDYIDFIHYQDGQNETFDIYDMLRKDEGLHRFHSSSIKNSVNVVAYLYPLVFFPLINNKKKIYPYIISIISLYLLMLTWSRTAILALLVFVIVYGAVSNSYYRKKIMITIVLLLLASIFFYDDILERMSSDSRLGSLDNIEKRIEMMSDYIMYVLRDESVSVFFGNEKSVEYLYRYANIRNMISSENMIIDTFVRRGVIGGCIFLILIYDAFKRARYLSRVNYNYGVFIFCIYVVLILITNTYLIRHTDMHLWIMIAIISKYYYLSKNIVNKGSVISELR